MAATQQDLSSAPTPVVNGRTPAPPIWPLELYRSAVGKKWVMAVTGIVLLGFVLAHMVGNLKVYLGAEDINHYGEFLRELLAPAPAPHGVAVAPADRADRRLRPPHPRRLRPDPDEPPGPARRLRRRPRLRRRQLRQPHDALDGRHRRCLFIVFHLADLTWGTANPDFVRGDAYNNLVASFERPPVAVIYIVANVALGIHLFHGAWSLFQSLGLNNPRFNRVAARASPRASPP